METRECTHALARLLRTVSDGHTDVKYLLSTGFQYTLIRKAQINGWLRMGGRWDWSVTITPSGAELIQKEALR